MATNPAGGVAYGDLATLPGLQNVGTAYRGDAGVNTPDASYTVAELLTMINAAVNTAGVTDSDGFGKASSVEAS